jgi:RNA polymerase sigma factor (sigma-70 family)
VRDTQRRDLEARLGEHQAFLRARLLGLGVRASAVDDAMQDVFEVLVRRSDAYDSRRPLRRWMAGVARKVARRHRERASKDAVFAVEEPKASSASDPERRAIAMDAHTRLESFLAQLSSEQWSVFVLSEIEGLRGTEIAAELDVNLSTVYARLRAAKQAFERAMKAERGRWLPIWAPPVLARGEAASGGLALASTSAMGALVLGTALFVVGRSQWCAEPSTDVLRSDARASAERVFEPGSGVAPRFADPAGHAGVEAERASTPTPDPDGWVPNGSGWSTSPEGVLSHEKHYKLVGDTALLRVTYVGDDDVAMTVEQHELVTEGLEVLEGPPDEPLVVPAGASVAVVVRLRAAQEGRVRFRLGMGSDGGKIFGGLTLVNEGGVLRRCRDDECIVTLTPEQVQARLSGEIVTFDVVNDCRHPVRYTLVPTDSNERPPPGTPVRTMQPGEETTLSIDRVFWLQILTEDDAPTGWVRPNDDDSLVQFRSDGDGCSWGATSPELRHLELPALP